MRTRYGPKRTLTVLACAIVSAANPAAFQWIRPAMAACGPPARAIPFSAVATLTEAGGEAIASDVNVKGEFEFIGWHDADLSWELQAGERSSREPSVATSDDGVTSAYISTGRQQQLGLERSGWSGNSAPIIM